MTETNLTNLKINVMTEAQKDQTTFGANELIMTPDNEEDIRPYSFVGQIILTTSSSFDPSLIFGGNWQQLSADAYLKIVSSNAGTLGGTSPDHKIPIESMPNHTHSTPVVSGSYTTMNGSGNTWVPIYNNNNVGYSGGGQAYYPYYYGVIAWLRTP